MKQTAIHTEWARTRGITLLGAALAMLMTVALWAQGSGGSCSRTKKSFTDCVSRCTTCSTGERRPDNSSCTCMVANYEVFCDCYPNQKCVDFGSLVNFMYSTIPYSTGKCSGGVCTGSYYPGGTSDFFLRISTACN
ncbi:MAG: hypothetical protein H7A45_13320 [Verrucomicrobiales bacterium]|nr:hypothetical protein [Verrucomicrobiales bacterium]MCP5528316.1 hypothetical protein [Verrucomicrobiales bacterium]